MLKKSITYENYNGDTVTEDFYFHLSKAELVEIELGVQGGLSNALQKIVEAEDGKTIIAEFKNILLTAYGVKSPDGKRFIKNEALREEFLSSEAYSVLFMEIVTDADVAAQFIQAIIPAGLVEEAENTARQETMTIEPSGVAKPDPRILTKAEIEEMTGQEFVDLADKIKSGEVVIED